MTSKQVAEKFIDFNWSDDITEEQKEMIYNMDNVSIEIKKGKDMIIHVFNDEHKFSMASDDNIEEIKDLVYKQILNRIKSKL
jgi:hypothetical protein